MMHKVKDVVSKFLHPSFLFSTNEDTDRTVSTNQGQIVFFNHSFQKRKRSSSDEELQTTTAETDSANGYATTSRSRCK